jgi:hypothetical protein
MTAKSPKASKPATKGKPPIALRRPPSPERAESLVDKVAEKALTVAAIAVPALRLPDALERRLDRFCRERGLERSAVLEQALGSYLDQAERPGVRERLFAVALRVRAFLASRTRPAAA